MPRGVYDRTESKFRKLESDKVALESELQNVRHELEKKQVELSAARKIIDTVKTHPGSPAMLTVPANMSERFTILRENLQQLAEARHSLIDSDSLNQDLVNLLDSEITAHLQWMSTLRAEVFGSPKENVVAPRAAAPGYLPLPPAQEAQVPQAFQSAVR